MNYLVILSGISIQNALAGATLGQDKGTLRHKWLEVL